MTATALEEKINRLPELPIEQFEVAGKLDYSDKVPVVTIRPYKFPAPAKPPNPVPLVKRAEYSVRNYYAQVTYPIVVCQPPPKEEFDVATLFKEERGSGPSLPESDGASIAKKVRYYKLTKLNGKKLQIPFWCSVRAGPWLALVMETESCIDGVPSSWQLSLIEAPEVFLSWYGEWTDIPSYPSLHVFMSDLAMISQYRMCCPGYEWCPPTMSCIPFQVHCQDPVPV